MTVAIIPGSFDPFTLGHLDLVKYATEHYDRVVVAVMVNPEKTYLFSVEERLTLAKLSLADYPKTEVIYAEGLLIDLYKKLNATAVVKGYRNQTDYDYEMKMDAWNREHCPDFQTVLIPCAEGHQLLSSTKVREKLAKGEDLTNLLHPSAIRYLKEENK